MINFLKKIFKNLGIDIKGYKITNNPLFSTVYALKYFNIDCVLDIGANEGGFALDLMDLGYKHKIISFEPLSSPYSNLIKKSKLHSNWLIADKMALGEKNTEIEINVSKNSVSSSILEMLHSHSAAAEDSKYIGTEKVKLQKLDLIAKDLLKDTNNYFIKIDTQGYESQVIEGGIETFTNAKGIMCELSIIYLYKDQKLWLDLINKIYGLGFKIWSIEPGFKHPKTGQILQFDALFFKSDLFE